MSGKLGDTGVGELFATKPGRASSLTGTLAAKPRPAHPEPTSSADGPAARHQVTPTSTPSQRRSAPSSNRPSEPKPAPPASSAVTVVYVTQEDIDWIARQRQASGRTSAQVVLTALEQHLDELTNQFASSPAPVRNTGLFATLSRPQPVVSPRHVQFGLRGIPAEDRRVLEQLVAETGAGSLSALVRRALFLARSISQGP